MASLIFTNVIDKHNRFALFQLFPEMASSYIKKCQRDLGDAYNFTFWNPTGHYVMNLANPQQREVVKCLLLINRQVSE